MKLCFNALALGRRRAALALAVLVCAAALACGDGRVSMAALAAPSAEFMSLSEVVPGMKGVGKTVVEGTRIDDFDVEILGVLKGDAPGGDLVLVRVSGKPMEAAGGIAAGMSGSPVYVGGRLLGAISHAYESADHSIGLVTPIEEMLKVVSTAARPIPGQSWLMEPALQVAGRSFSRVAIAAATAPRADRADSGAGETMVMVPVTTPVMVSSASKRALDRLARELEPFGLKVIQAGGAGAVDAGTRTELEPGSAVGVQLVRGDVSVTAIGTVTYRRGAQALAFGHPVLARGNCAFFATGAFIHHVVPADPMPFKVASPLGVAGTIAQDRMRGVLVDVGRTPPTLPVTVIVRDQDSAASRILGADVVLDELLTPDLVGTVVLSCLDAVVDRVGSGTSRVTFEIEGEGLPGRVARDNMFYSATDVSAESLKELLDDISAILENEFAAVRLTRVKAEFEVREARRTARVERADVARPSVRPGDEVEVKVTLQPFRGVRETKTVTIRIPEGTPEGPLQLTVRGGGVRAAGEGAEDGAKQPQPTVAESLENLVRELVERERNNDIVVEFYPGEPGDALSEDAVPVNEDFSPVSAAGMQEARKAVQDPPRREDGEKPRREAAGGGEESEGIVKARIATGFVIEGETTVEIRVEPAEAEEEPQTQPAPAP